MDATLVHAFKQDTLHHILCKLIVHLLYIITFMKQIMHARIAVWADNNNIHSILRTAETWLAQRTSKGRWNKVCLQAIHHHRIHVDKYTRYFYYAIAVAQIVVKCCTDWLEFLYSWVISQDASILQRVKEQGRIKPCAYILLRRHFETFHTRVFEAKKLGITQDSGMECMRGHRCRKPVLRFHLQEGEWYKRLHISAEKCLKGAQAPLVSAGCAWPKMGLI